MAVNTSKYPAIQGKNLVLFARKLAEAKEKPMYWRTAVGIIASFVCLAMINWFGYLLSVTPFMAFLMALLGMRHKILNPLIAIGITGILYFTFSVGLNVPLPVGSFFE